MVINALNSGASVFMADFEDSHSPTWTNLIEGQINLRDAIRRTIAFTAPERQDVPPERARRDAAGPARAAGTWTRSTSRSTASRSPARLFDFGLYFFHNARRLLGTGTGPYFYLPKLESHLEARLWNDVFRAAQERARPAARARSGRRC